MYKKLIYDAEDTHLPFRSRLSESSPEILCNEFEL